MNEDERTPAEVTAARLRHATPGSATVMIPGARETRSPPRIDPVAAVARREAERAVPDAGRLEYEREGGGAPSERSNGSVRFERLRFWRFGSRS
jgi:hypothetical protein